VTPVTRDSTWVQAGTFGRKLMIRVPDRAACRDEGYVHDCLATAELLRGPLVARFN
jgi:hypothetical protein